MYIVGVIVLAAVIMAELVIGIYYGISVLIMAPIAAILMAGCFYLGAELTFRQ